ncbi:TadE/TadG family type IV pilus assembly protein [Pacificoceanicola onchidii]|uniref:TadE/TadG family type IV pilus assembly protein n=1 Tax=Pacificoceanicola onchidii TaxID=2562685 RepID=UPI001455F19B|nr:pilus assembly protein TadG-related protein [Pacificoceanicola onchidii]
MKRTLLHVDAFATDEDGNVTIFSVFMVMLILIITGASIDIMRFEATRAKMQSTMDRAVLAAADLDQEQDPTAVVHDYMNKAGLESVLATVSVDDGLNYRTVQADGTIDLQTFFLKMSGFDTLTAPASSTAEEKISNIEISLVLDVSGSMGGTRIENMREAASQFVDTVIEGNSESGLTTISVVPYNATVNLGDDVSTYFNLENLYATRFQNNGWGNGDQDAPGNSLCHNAAENYEEGQASAACTDGAEPIVHYSNCATFEDADFRSASIDPTDVLGRLAHFDRYSTNQYSTSLSSPWCKTGSTSAVIAHSSDGTLLKNRINSLNAGGNTAIDLGMKWGVALLDPALNPVVSQMATDGLVVAGAADRPSAYDNAEVIKFIVVMTDGENTTQYDLKEEYKYGNSEVYVDDRGTADKSDDRYSVKVIDRNGGHDDTYYWVRFRDGSYSDRYRTYPDGGANAVRLPNVELFSRFGTKAAAIKFLEKPYYDGKVSYSTYSNMYYGSEATVNGSSADSRLSAICKAARDEGIVVFAVGFEAPAGGQAAMEDCASSAAHYFDVEGVEITETFHAIARQINSLRLIQ